MKRTMYAFGVIAPILLLIGITFKLFHWPGAGIILTLGLFITASVFLPLFAMVRIRDTRQQGDSVPMGLYLTGMIAGILAILGALFKIQHWPGASIALTLGLGTLAFAFLPIYASVKKKEAAAKNKSFNSRQIIGGVIAGALVFIGALFKILHWPGAGIVILVSWSLVGVILLPYLVLNQLKQKENQINNFLIIILVAVTISLLILARVRSQPWDLLIGYHLPGENLISNAELLETQSDQILENAFILGSSEAVEQMKNVAAEADELCTYMNDVKVDMATFYYDEDEIHKVIDEDGEVILEEIYYNYGSGTAYEIVVKRDEYKLFHMLKDFSKHSLELTKNKALATYIKTSTQNYSPHKPKEGLSEEEIWANYYINVDFPRTLNTLSMYMSTVRMIEYQLLSELQKSTFEVAE